MEEIGGKWGEGGGGTHARYSHKMWVVEGRGGMCLGKMGENGRKMRRNAHFPRFHSPISPLFPLVEDLPQSLHCANQPIAPTGPRPHPHDRRCRREHEERNWIAYREDMRRLWLEEEGLRGVVTAAEDSAWRDLMHAFGMFTGAVAVRMEAEAQEEEDGGEEQEKEEAPQTVQQQWQAFAEARAAETQQSVRQMQGFSRALHQQLEYTTVDTDYDTDVPYRPAAPRTPPPRRVPEEKAAAGYHLELEERQVRLEVYDDAESELEQLNKQVAPHPRRCPRRWEGASTGGTGCPPPDGEGRCLLRADPPQSSGTGTVRGLRWHSRPRERQVDRGHSGVRGRLAAPPPAEGEGSGKAQG